MPKNKLPNIVTIAILTVITVLCWVFFSAYRVFKKEVTPPVPEDILSPINPNLDKEMLANIKNRYYIEEGQAPVFDYQLASPSPINEETLLVEETPTSSPEASFSPTATASATPTGVE